MVPFFFIGYIFMKLYRDMYQQDEVSGTVMVAFIFMAFDFVLLNCIILIMVYPITRQPFVTSS